MDKLELQFIHQEIKKGLRDIFAAQANIAGRRIYQEGKDRRVRQGTGHTVRGRSGALMDSLENRGRRFGKVSWAIMLNLSTLFISVFST